LPKAGDPAGAGSRKGLLIGVAIVVVIAAVVAILLLTRDDDSGTDVVATPTTLDRTTTTASETTTSEPATTTSSAAPTTAPATTAPATTAPPTTAPPATTVPPTAGPYLPAARAELFRPLCDLAADAARTRSGNDLAEVRFEYESLVNNSDAADAAASAPLAQHYTDLGQNAATTQVFIDQECKPLGLA
jgi:hypothetical protein